MSKLDFSTFLSPFTWRYGSEKMREIFSELNKYKIWRKIWVSLAQAQNQAGLVSNEELEDLVKNQNNIDIERAQEIEKETKHDVVAAIREYAEKAKIGGGKIHLGATSMDVVDNTDIIRMKEAIALIEEKLTNIIKIFQPLIEKYASFPCIGYTHLQPAEPTTVGYRLAFYAQDLLIDLETLQFIKKILKAKGMKGAVGTAASYTSVLEDNKMTTSDMEKIVMQNLGIDAVTISTQVYPRKYDYLVLSFLASIASSSAKFAGDLRILQSPNIGEWSESFGKKQVGSSAMPFKKNPINSEKICSLARFVLVLPQVALENATLSYLERTLDDSANKRLVLSESFLAVDEILTTFEKIVSGLVINEKRINHNLNLYAPFAATESIMMQAVKKGADRQKMHELLREISMVAWAEIQDGKPNNMGNLLLENEEIKIYLKKEEVQKLLDVKSHIGNAKERTEILVKQIKSYIK